MDQSTIKETIEKLERMSRLLTEPKHWCQGDGNGKTTIRLDDAINIVHEDQSAYRQNCGDDKVYPGDLGRGKIPEAAWYLRQAMNKTAPEFGGLIYKWNDAPDRTHEEVLSLIASAIDLAEIEFAQIRTSYDDFDLSKVVLHRSADREGRQLCAMSALSKELGYATLTDIPAEVDPALAALVNLLNDRANNRARQLLISRLKLLPNTGRTDICSLISRAFFPQIIGDNGFGRYANVIADCKGGRVMTNLYARLSERLLEPDGVGFLAAGCFTLTAALKAKDKVTKDILAVSAASQVIDFETGEGWFDLLYVLDYILGLKDHPYVGSIQAMGDQFKYFGDEAAVSENPAHGGPDDSRPFCEVYDFGIEVKWFPAVVAKFPFRLEEIARQILDEIKKTGSDDIFMHRFSFDGCEVMIASSWDEELDMLSADADLVAYQDVAGEIDIDGDGEAETLLVPVPASEAKTVH